MYQLTAFRLVNWLHFTDVTRPVSGTTLLTGENGEGKSTILDALQLALVADLRQVSFNKAVGHTTGRVKRTLKGYVLWAEKSQDDKAPTKYRRQSATAYVLLQFEDRPVPGAPARLPFICGVAIEAVAKGGEPTRLHVVVPGLRLEDLPVVHPGSRLAMSLSDFEVLVKQRRHATATSTPDTYLDALRFQMGRLPKSLFPSLLTKGLAFKPMASVRDFVVEFLLEPRPIDTGRLVDNLVHYQEMQRESERAAGRLAALDHLVHLGEDVTAKERARDIAQFVYLRAEVEDAAQEQVHQESLAEDYDQTCREATERRNAEEERKEAAAREVSRLDRALAADDRVREKKSLEDEAAGLEQRIGEADEAERQVRDHYGVQRALLEHVLAPAVPPALLFDAELRDALGNESVIGADPQLPFVRTHWTQLNPEGIVTGRPLEGWTTALGQINTAIGALRRELTRRHRSLRDEGVRLRADRDRLAAGKVQYGFHLEAFRYGLDQAVKRGEFTLRRPIVPFCELIDDVDATWQQTVESWLGARRFDLIPDPDDYPAVNAWYEKHRDACPTPSGEQTRLFGVSVVNMGRVLQHRTGGFAAAPLSDAVHTSSRLAQAYLEYLLGRVQQCASVVEFGRYDHAATPQGFLYRGHRTERVRPPEQLVLGRAARVAEQRRLDQALGAVAKQLADLGPIDQWLRTVEQAYQRAQHRWPLVADRVSRIESRGELTARLSRVRQQAEAIDLSHVATLEGELAIAKSVLKEASDAYLEARDTVTKMAEKADQARAASASAAERHRTRLAELNEAFPAAETNPEWDEHRARFDERMSATDTARDLATRYRIRHKAAMELADKAWKAFAEARAHYERAYEPIVADTPVPVALLREEAERWRNTKLPEYARQIEERIANARVQLLDDVLAQLHSHFADLRKTLTMLNRALQSCSFGNDQYEFIWTPNDTLRPFHDLITELAPAFDLAGAGSAYDILADNPVMRERLDQLLGALTANRTDPLQGLEAVRDYREYFDYDIRVMDGQGLIYRLSRNAGVASGGEVQTPTYVALFASLQQMYGATASAGAQCGLFLVDESFALLDDRRIPALMSWVKQLGLQGILAMPTGREAHFARYADTMLLVSRDTAGLGRLDDAHDLGKTIATDLAEVA